MALLICIPGDFAGITEPFSQAVDDQIIHLPLGEPAAIEHSPQIDEVFEHFNSYKNVVLENARSAEYFFKLFEKRDEELSIDQQVFFARTTDAAKVAGRFDIPTIEPLVGSKAIDVVETMLRFRRLGPTLYPCHIKHPAEIPGLLEELGIPVNELPVWTDNELDNSTVASYRSIVGQNSPEVILFHSVTAVNTIPALFREIDFTVTKNIAVGERVAHKIQEQGWTVTHIIEDLNRISDFLKKI